MSDPGVTGDAGAAAGPAGVAKDLLDLLVCPLGKAPLRLEGNRLVCTRCGLSYAIEEGIPNMLVDEARLPDGVQELRQLACYPGAAS
jgi:uncharacterized protein YbaR (Trm112 family)